MYDMVIRYENLNDCICVESIFCTKDRQYMNHFEIEDNDLMYFDSYDDMLLKIEQDYGDVVLRDDYNGYSIVYIVFF